MTVLASTGGIRKVTLWLCPLGISTTQIYLRADPMEKLIIVELLIPPKLRQGASEPAIH